MRTSLGSPTSCEASEFTDLQSPPLMLISPRIKVSLRNENTRQWHEVEQDFKCEYRKVRDRQMQELELEDKILSKVPVRYVENTHSIAIMLF